MATSFTLGKGTVVQIALLPVGSRVEPATRTITVGGTPVAKSASAGTIAVTALAAGEAIPAGTYLGFIAPVTGKTVVVQTTADVAAGATSIPVARVPETIAAASTAAYPLRLSGRTSANLGRSGTRTSAIDFDSSGYADGLTTSIEQTITLNGNWLPNDAGFATAEFAFTELREIFVWLELPKSSAAFSKGRVYKGAASITSLPLEVPADGIITGNIEVAFNGKPTVIDEVPVP